MAASNGCILNDDFVVGYRVDSLVTAGFVPFGEVRPKPERRRFRTKREADNYKQLLQARHGGDVAACVSPIYPPKAKLTRRMLACQQSFAATWPLQSTPQP